MQCAKIGNKRKRPKQSNKIVILSVSEGSHDKYRISFAKAKVEVEKRLDGSIHIRYKDQYLNFKEISSDEIKKIKTNTLPLEKLLTGDIFTLHQG